MPTVLFRLTRPARLTRLSKLIRSAGRARLALRAPCLPSRATRLTRRVVRLAFRGPHVAFRGARLSFQPPHLTRRGAQALMAVLAAAGLLAGSAWQTASARPAEQMATVSMRDNIFQPEDLTIQAGTTVTWANRGRSPHTATSEDGLWDSGTVQSDGSFSFTFTEPGTYPYVCEFHASLGMVGTIVVEAGEPPPPTDEPTESPPTARPTGDPATPTTAPPVALASPTATGPVSTPPGNRAGEQDAGEQTRRAQGAARAPMPTPMLPPRARDVTDMQSAQAARTYVVQPGDTLFSIARRFGISVTALARANNLPNVNRIFAGMRLVIPEVGRPQVKPPGQASVYTVRRGDTVFAIARRLGASPLAIIRANRLVNPDLIFPGMRLAIPGAVAMPAPPRPACLTYVVHPGDTVFGIAMRFRTTIRQLVAANGIHPNLIFVGQPLLVCPGR